VIRVLLQLRRRRVGRAVLVPAADDEFELFEAEIGHARHISNLRSTGKPWIFDGGETYRCRPPLTERRSTVTRSRAQGY
jgi:hypothetical protein